MNNLINKFLLNVSLLSIILSLIYSFLLINIDKLGSNDFEFSDPGGIVSFIVFFLLTYVFNVIVSVINYLVIKYVARTLEKKLIIFNLIGILLVGVICYFLKDIEWIILLISFFLFSFVCMFNKK